MTTREWVRLMLRERRAFPRDSLDWEWRTAAACKYLWVMRGVPVLEWTEWKRTQDHCPAFHSISQHRRIGDGDQYTLEGQGVIKLLSHWQHPEIGNDDLRQKFNRVEKLLRDLLERPNVTLEVPHTHKEILVHDTKTGLRLPLESHGTGIHQLIIMAIAVLSEDEALYGIEEPEIHLHPVLQKRFLRFLREETTGRYIITTHSPVLIAPAEDVDVIHLKMVDGVTIPRRIETDVGTLEALEDLGIRPSDLLQANSVVWVEGPSDRTYIKRWLELLAPDLTEGIDYSMMFYGGRLLSHLSLEREVEETLESMLKLKLLRINQHSAIVMDSDRKKSVKDPQAFLASGAYTASAGSYAFESIQRISRASRTPVNCQRAAVGKKLR